MKQLVKRILIQWNLFFLIKDLFFYRNEINYQQRKFYSSFLDKNDLIFDVGANIGQRSKIFTSISKKVVAFEPQLSCISTLRSRFAYNRSIIISSIALSNSKGSSEMFISESSTISTLSQSFIDGVGGKIFGKQSWSQRQKVEIDTLDNQIAKYGNPQFIKIDVEGYEVEVLSGLSIAGSNISFEFIPGDLDKINSCLKHINGLSTRYRYNVTLGENLKFLFEKNLEFEQFIKLDELRNAQTFGDIYAFIEDS